MAEHSSQVARLQVLREAAGLSQSELARKSGIPQQRISSYERGIRAPKLPSALALCQTLKCQLRDLGYEYAHDLAGHEHLRWVHDHWHELTDAQREVVSAVVASIRESHR
jgi:transcriptional regulator with XRE-family HTH domain